MATTGQEDGAHGTGAAGTSAGTSDVGPPGSGYPHKYCLRSFLSVAIKKEYETCYLQIPTLDYETAGSREDEIHDYTGSTALP